MTSQISFVIIHKYVTTSLKVITLTEYEESLVHRTKIMEINKAANGTNGRNIDVNE